MPLVTVTMYGDKEVAAKFGRTSVEVVAAVRRKVLELTLALQRKVKVDHLSGPTGPNTLSVGVNSENHTGGQLRSSVFQEVQNIGQGVLGRVGYSSDVPYAGIHEFGGIVHIPEIRPVKAQALHWVTNGQDIFRKYARAHSVTIPERAPLRTAFKEMQPAIRSGLKDAVAEGIQKAGPASA